MSDTDLLPGSGMDPDWIGRADPAPETTADTIAEAVAAVGVPPSVDLVSILEEIVHDLAIAKCAEHLRDIALRLDGSPVGAVFRRVLLGDDEPVRKAAQRAGVSHVAVLKSSEKARRRLGGVTKPRL